LLKEINVYKEDRESIKPALEKIVTLTVRDVMNPEPFTVVPNHTIQEVGKFFSEHHRVNPIPVIDENRRVLGIISRYDIIRLYTGTDKSAEAIYREPSVDKKVDLFVDQFESNFIFVNKWRPVFWHIAIPLFVLMGVLIVLAIIFKIEISPPPA
jgi:CBS domain-containing protein